MTLFKIAEVIQQRPLKQPSFKCSLITRMRKMSHDVWKVPISVLPKQFRHVSY